MLLAPSAMLGLQTGGFATGIAQKLLGLSEVDDQIRYLDLRLLAYNFRGRCYRRRECWLVDHGKSDAR